MRAKHYRPLLLLLASGVLTVSAALHGAGCQAAPIQVAVPSLEYSGKVSFVCLDPPGPAGSIEEPLTKCTSQQFTAVNEYLSEDDAGDIDAGSGTLPHLYALVTQTLHGEVAVIDTSSTLNSILDENPLEPGANFLPVGAGPTGIVSTPGSIATFVGVSDSPGIFAIPSSQIRPVASDPSWGSFGGNSGIPFVAPDAGPVPQLSSWPACALPSPPGDIILVPDPAVNGQERETCDSPYTTPGEGDLISTHEKNGRQKLVVAMPTAGGIIVLDAQTILDLPPGSFGACPVERWVPLEVDLSGLDAMQPQPTGSACVNPLQNVPKLRATCSTDADCSCATSTVCGVGACQGGLCGGPYAATPGGISYANNQLYIADLTSPVVHVVAMPTPCEPVERAPLLPTSVAKPETVVTTKRVAAAPFPTPDLRQFVYATDLDDGSIMIFDVGPGATSRRPLTRPNAQWNPFQPQDRVTFPSSVADIIVVQRDIPEQNPITGISVSGVRCDPDPFLVTCTATSTSCDIASSYQTHTDPGDTTAYAAGAGPLKLRGEFAYAALTDGKIGVIDIDDFDAPCRGPAQPDPRFGYPPVGASCTSDVECGTARCTQGTQGGACEPCTKDSQCALAPDPTATDALNNGHVCLSGGVCLTANKTSLEYSYNIVEQNAPRSSNYETENDTVGNHVPGLLTYPLQYTYEGSLVPFDPSSPRMISLDSTAPLFVSGAPAVSTDLSQNHLLTMNFEDPRAQIADQNWTVAYEGAIPGFETRTASLQVDPTKGPLAVSDPDSRFCDLGVLSEAAEKEILTADNADASKAAGFADYVQVTTPLPIDEDAYWDNGAKDGVLCGTTCSYDACLGEFGDLDLPLAGRDLRILEAYQDHVEVEMRNKEKKGDGTLLDLRDLCCCLTGPTYFTVRGGKQWMVTGDQSGFIHHVVADPVTGQCRNTCDPIAARKNARVIEASSQQVSGAVAKESDFQNPMFRFAILSGTTPSSFASRDNNFRFSTNGSFAPLLVTLTADSTVQILPSSITYLSATGELAITDGSKNGLIFVSLSSATLTRSYF